MTARRGLVTMVLALVLAGTSPAWAQGSRRAAPRKPAPAKRVRAPQPRRVDPPRAPAAAERAAAAEPAAGSETLAQVENAPAAARSAPKPRVYTFGGLDVEGKLKAPQLLYFRSRMRQELDTSSAEKRSFLKELEKTADEKGL